mmetsp:Transcript_3251/g.5005  ORF Transcript_3251/g.5005 Transcript_3251/m.5005 type:complete len:183 (+) Transcript_3251:3690-4238(+)
MFSRWGRRAVFILGCCIGSMGGLVGVLAIEYVQCWQLILISSFLLGLSQGVAQFLRFAATDLYTMKNIKERSRAVTLVLAGGIVAAFAGPQAAVHSRKLEPWLSHKYSGCFALIVLCNILNFILLLLVRFVADDYRSRTENVDSIHAEEERSSSLDLVLLPPEEVYVQSLLPHWLIPPWLCS